jgi:hypothetical protein
LQNLIRRPTACSRAFPCRGSSMAQ